MNALDRFRILAKPVRWPRRLLIVTLAAASLWSWAGCVDLTPPWQQGSATGGAAGGIGLGGSGGVWLDAGEAGGSPASDGPVATGGAVDGSIAPVGGAGGAIDASIGGAGGHSDGGPAGIDGGLDLGGGAPEVPLPPSDTGPAGLDSGGSDTGGTGGLTGAGGATGAGSTGGVPGPGAGGATGAGGTGVLPGTDAGGVTGAGGSGGRDAGADSPSDVALDHPPDLPPDLPLPGVEAGALLTGLTAYYPCESAEGNTLPDVSGNGNDGTLMDGTTLDGGTSTPGFGFVAGKVGNALSVAKAGSGYVAIPPAVFADATDITIAAWVQATTAQSWPRIFDVGINANIFVNNTNTTKYMNLVPQNSSSRLVFAITTGGHGAEQTLTAAALPAKTWKHIAVVLTTGQGVLYVDGSQAATSSSLTLRPVDLGVIDYAFLGKSQFPADPYFDGVIDEFRVYRRALDASEVAALYHFTGP
jgi:hypothetical protein